MWKTVGAVAMAALLSACLSRDLVKGTVVDKRHVEASKEYRHHQQFIGDILVSHGYWSVRDEKFIVVVDGWNKYGARFKRTYYLKSLAHWKRIEVGAPAPPELLGLTPAEPPDDALDAPFGSYRGEGV